MHSESGYVSVCQWRDQISSPGIAVPVGVGWAFAVGSVALCDESRQWMQQCRNLQPTSWHALCELHPTHLKLTRCCHSSLICNFRGHLIKKWEWSHVGSHSEDVGCYLLKYFQIELNNVCFILQSSLLMKSSDVTFIATSHFTTTMQLG